MKGIGQFTIYDLRFTIALKWQPVANHQSSIINQK